MKFESFLATGFFVRFRASPGGPRRRALGALVRGPRPRAETQPRRPAPRPIACKGPCRCGGDVKARRRRATQITRARVLPKWRATRLKLCKRHPRCIQPPEPQHCVTQCNTSQTSPSARFQAQNAASARANSQLRRRASHRAMAEEKKSRACHYLQPQEWWFEDKTPIESVFLMM